MWFYYIKLPSKAKADQITSIDKARMVYKIGSVTDEFMERLEKRIMKNLDIKFAKNDDFKQKYDIIILRKYFTTFGGTTHIKICEVQFKNRRNPILFA